MSDLRQAAQQALEALTVAWQQNPHWQITESMRTLRAALSEPVQEPLAWMKVENFIDAEGLWDERVTFNHDGDGKPLYTAPTPQPEQPVAFIEPAADNDCAYAYADGWNACVRAHKRSPTPRKPVVELTDEEIALISGECAASAHRHDDFRFARSVIVAYQKKQGETK